MSLLKRVARIFDPVVNWAALRYQATVGAELRKYGLRYEDLLDPTHNNDVEEALNRMPPDLVLERNQRLKRAMDLSCKHVYLSKEMQAKQTPFKPYLQPYLDQVLLEKQERLQLGSSPPYQRQIP
eukprot:jgi/Chlat1/5505/Chrsp360S00832